MKKQKGVALIVVMSLLAVSLMIGLMSMQTSQVDERLAGNYRAAAEAQMAAEFGAAYGIEMMLGTPDYFEEHDSGKACEDFAEPGLSEQERRAVAVDGDVDWYKVDDDDIDAEIIGCRDEGKPLYLSWGQVRNGGGAIIAESFVSFFYEAGGGGAGGALVKDVIEALSLGSLFEQALLVGGALTVNGSARIEGGVRVGGAYQVHPQDDIDSLSFNDLNNINEDYGEFGSVPDALIPSGSFFSKIAGEMGLESEVYSSSCVESLGVKYCSVGEGETKEVDFGDLEDRDISAVVVKTQGEGESRGKVKFSGSVNEGSDFFIASDGRVELSGMGGSKMFSGFVWSREVQVSGTGAGAGGGKGNSFYEGAFVSGGSAGFSGGLNMRFKGLEEIFSEGDGVGGGPQIRWQSL